MNEYHFTDLYIGKSECFKHIISEDEMEKFKYITKDINPLHINEAYAINQGFNGRVVYGMLSASLISTLAGVYLPGRYCIIQQVEIKFSSPVYVGDELLVQGEVTELNDSVQQAVIKVEMRNNSDKKVVRAKLKVGFTE